MAGHCCFGCCPPHRPQPVCLELGVDFRRSIVSILTVGLSLVSDFICLVATSLARHMSRAFSRVRDDSRSNLLRVWSSSTPSTMRSRMRLSVSVPNSHVLALVHRSARSGQWALLVAGSCC